MQDNVEAKFRLNSYTTEMHGRWPKPTDGSPAKVEKRTLNFTPVCSDDPASENKKFWDATPSGSIQLGVVNPAAWEFFQIEGEYLVTFTRVK